MRIICLRIFIVVKSHALEEEIGNCYYIFVYKIYKKIYVWMLVLYIFF